MKKLILILLFANNNFVNAQYLFSNEEASNALAKYWLYKWRFLNDFIKVGDQMGESLPVAERAAVNQPIFRFGDGTQKLGMYINLLATEYKLLYDNERWVDLEKTKTELYYAIEAYRRLDCTAEWYRPYYKDPDYDWCNGYFMRSDTDIDFLEQPATPWISGSTLKNVDLLNQPYTDFCYDIDPALPSGQVNELRVFVDPWGDQDCSEFAVQEYNPDPNGHLVNEESQDQVFCIMQGLGMVIILVPEGNQTVILNDGTQINYDFNLESLELYKDMIWYIKKETNVSATETDYDIGHNDWVIDNPINEEVARGSDAFQFSYPMAVISDFLTNTNSYQDLTTLAFRQIWNVQQHNLQLTQIFTSGDGTLNVSMQCQLAAMSDSWRWPSIPPPIPNPPFSNNLVNTTPKKLFNKAANYDWTGFYMPLWSIWNNKPIPGLYEVPTLLAIYDDLNSAPCQGPYRFAIGSNIYFPQQWAGVFKYFKGLDVTQNGLGDYISGYYNGNDYMLLNNFHYLISQQPLPYFHNLIDRYVDYGVPGAISQSSFEENNINAFNTITADNVVEANNEINFRAGYEITLKPGFHAEAGTDFHAYIEPFTCVNGEYRNSQSDSTLATAYGFNEKFQFKNHGIIDYSNDESEEMTNEELEPEIDPSHVILVYPNPSDGKFSYLIPEKTDENIVQTVEIYNTIGDLVFSQQVNYSGQNVLDLGDVTTGIYIIKVISGEIVYSSKLMVE